MEVAENISYNNVMINVMKFEKYGTHIGIVKSKKTLFDDEQGFIDFLLQVREEADADIIIIEKAVLPCKFYDLESGFAIMINQKLVNYRTQMAVVGDFGKAGENDVSVDSKTFHDFIMESNESDDLIFLRSINEAISYFTE